MITAHEIKIPKRIMVWEFGDIIYTGTVIEHRSFIVKIKVDTTNEIKTNNLRCENWASLDPMN